MTRFRSVLLVLVALMASASAFADVDARQVLRAGQARFANSEGWKVDYSAARDLYEVKLLQGDRLINAKFRASTGAYIRANLDGDAGDVNQVRRALGVASITLLEAMDIAQQRLPGFLREADVDLQNDARNGREIDVKIVRRGLWWEVKIDSRTGRVIKVQRDDDND